MAKTEEKTNKVHVRETNTSGADAGATNTTTFTISTQTGTSHTSRTAANKPGTKKTNAEATKERSTEAPFKLELFDSDTVGFCDAETGVCTVPQPLPPDTANGINEKREPKSHER